MKDPKNRFQLFFFCRLIELIIMIKEQTSIENVKCIRVFNFATINSVSQTIHRTETNSVSNHSSRRG